MTFITVLREIVEIWAEKWEGAAISAIMIKKDCFRAWLYSSLSSALFSKCQKFCKF
jgi:hypothetical protein